MTGKLNELALFAGAGGGLLASRLLGWDTVCAVEIDEYCRRVLFQRQRDKMLPKFPIWDDIRTFDGKPWRGKIDIISGGFPCQDISAAGKGEGLAGKRSGLWFEMLRIIEEIQPCFVFAENSPNLRTRGLGTVIEGLTRLGYDCRWGVLGAWHAGAPHRRNRMWIVAYSESFRCRSWRLPGRKKTTIADVNIGFEPNYGRKIADANGQTLWQQPRWRERSSGPNTSISRITDWWDLPRFAGVDDGLARRMDRVRATGNGQVPAVAALAWHILTNDIFTED